MNFDLRHHADVAQTAGSLQEIEVRVDQPFVGGVVGREDARDHDGDVADRELVARFQLASGGDGFADEGGVILPSKRLPGA